MGDFDFLIIISVAVFLLGLFFGFIMGSTFNDESNTLNKFCGYQNPSLHYSEGGATFDIREDGSLVVPCSGGLPVETKEVYSLEVVN